MRLWERLFGNRQLDGTQGTQQQWLEKHNKGTRQETESQATNFWIACNINQKFDPFILYIFTKEESARAALLELDCMHLAQDSRKIICSEVLIFGCYQIENGKFEAIVCGADLSNDIWNSARAAFLKHGGLKIQEKEPQKTNIQSASQTIVAEKVQYVREDQRQQMGQTMIYRIHKGLDAVSAKAFLEENPVMKSLFYIVVETPEGNYCRDKDGIYKE